MTSLTPVIALLILVVVVAFVYIGLYNTCIRKRQKVEEAWSGISVQLKRRLDLIPNLINTVKGYATHERELLQHVTELRNAAMQAPSGDHRERIQTENMLTSSLKSVFALAENYPDLKANTNFVEMQRQLAETEDQISAARRIYNGNASDFNATVQSFPTSIVAGMHGFRTVAFFQMDEAETAAAAKAPLVRF